MRMSAARVQLFFFECSEECTEGSGVRLPAALLTALTTSHYTRYKSLYSHCVALLVALSSVCTQSKLGTSSP
jgi:hypothetical protein